MVTCPVSGQLDFLVHEHFQLLVSTEVGDRIRLQFPMRDIYLGM